MQLLHERGGSRTYWGRKWLNTMTGPMYALRWVPHISVYYILYIFNLTNLILSHSSAALPARNTYQHGSGLKSFSHGNV